MWIRTGQYGLAKVYSSINRGKYYGLKPNAENVERFREIYKGDGANMEVSGYKFKHIQTCLLYTSKLLLKPLLEKHKE